MTKKAKAKSGIGQGTGKKGWNRWKTGANKAKSFKPYTSKANKKTDGAKSGQSANNEPPEWIDG